MGSCGMNLQRAYSKKDNSEVAVSWSGDDDDDDINERS